MSRRDEDLAREIRTHLELEAAEREADGQPAAAARRAATRAFGNATIVREDARAVWTPVWLQQTAQDIRYALRMARRAPWFTAGALLIVALGIAASTTIFSALRAVVLAPLPFDRPEELVRISQTNVSRGVTDFSVSLPLVRDWRSRSASWSDVAASRVASVNVLGLGEPQQLRARFTSWNMLSMLGVRLATGRTFTAADDVVGGGRVAIISNRLWREAFAPCRISRAAPSPWTADRTRSSASRHRM